LRIAVEHAGDEGREFCDFGFGKREERETHAVRLYKREWDKKTNLVLIREVVSYGKN
jgi:hypothetical protein